MTLIITWLDQEFGIYTKTAEWNDVPGIYIFSGVTPQNLWRALYVGQADSFRNRLANHERWDEAVQLGATHVHAKTVRPVADRNQIERALIQAFHPQLNTHHRL